MNTYIRSAWPKEPFYNTKPFVATIYGKNEDELQSVFCYPLDEDEDFIDIEIKMEIYVSPSGIRDDVEGALWSHARKMLGNLKFSLAPQDKVIAP